MDHPAIIAWLKRFGFGVLALLSFAAAAVGTIVYAIPSLDDFNRFKPTMEMVVGEIVLWAICLGAWGFAIRLSALTFRKERTPAG